MIIRKGLVVNLVMKLKNYLDHQVGKECLAVSMEGLLSPFGLYYQGSTDTKLELGLVLDNLQAEFKLSDMIDPIDVATSALDLGYIDAEIFLDEAPLIIAHLSKSNNL